MFGEFSAGRASMTNSGAASTAPTRISFFAASHRPKNPDTIDRSPGAPSTIRAFKGRIRHQLANETFWLEQNNRKWACPRTIHVYSVKAARRNGQDRAPDHR